MSEQGQGLGERSSVTSSYHQNQSSAHRGNDRSTSGNRDILLRLLRACNTFSGKDASSLCCVIQDCSNKLNPPVSISLRASKLNYELVECKPVVGNHTVLTSTLRSYLLSTVCIRIRLLRTDLSHRRSIYKTNYLCHSHKLEIICRGHV